MSISIMGNVGVLSGAGATVSPSQLGSSIRALRAMVPQGVSGTGDGVVSLSDRAVTQVGAFDIGGKVYKPDQNMANALDLMMSHSSDAIAAAGGKPLGMSSI